MNELQNFNNPEFSSVRVVAIENEPWWCGKDICDLFGDTNHNRSLKRIDDSDKQRIEVVDALGRAQTAVFINEAGVYALLFAMQPQKANNDGVSNAYPIEVQTRIEKLRRFKRWVTSEVLPSIRKTGSYTLPAVDYQMPPESISDEAINRLIANPRFIARLVIMFDKVTKENAHLKNDNEQLRIEAKENEGKISYANAVQPHAKEITITELARMLYQLGVADAGSIRLYNWLRENEYLIKRKGNTWNLPTQVYTNSELFMVRTVQVPNQNIVKRQTLVTPKGQEYFIKKFAKAKSLNDVTSKAITVATAINNNTSKVDEETSN